MKPCGARREMCRHGLLGLFFVLLPCVVFAPALGPRLLAPADGLDFYLPGLLAADKIWTPYLFAGFPSGADPQELRLYPLRWLLVDLLRSYDLFVLSALAIAGWGMATLARALTGHTLAAVLAGVAFALAGFQVGHLRHPTMLHTLAWLPWTLLALRSLAAACAGALSPTQPSPTQPSTAPPSTALPRSAPARVGARASDAQSARAARTAPALAPRTMPTHSSSWGWPRHRTAASRTVMVALALSLLVLGGHPQIQLYAAAVLVGWTVLLAVRMPRGRRSRFLVAALLAVGLALLLTAPQWLPFLELLRVSARSGLAVGEWSTFALPLRHLPLLVAPQAYRDFEPDRADWSIVEASGHLGFLPWLLGIAGLLAAPRAGRLWALVALALLALLVALGPDGGLGPVLHELPGLSSARAPGRALAVLDLAGALLAALACGALVTAPPALRRRAIAWTAVIALVSVAGGGVAMATGVLAPGVRLAGALPALLALFMTLLALAWWGAVPAAPGRCAALVAVFLLELVSAAWSAEWRSRLAHVDELNEPWVMARVRAELEEHGQRYLPLWGTRQPLESGPPNRSRLWRLPSASGFQPLRLARYSDLTGIDLAGIVPLTTVADPHRALDLLACRLVGVPAVYRARWPLEDAGRWRDRPDLSVGLSDSFIIENRRALPRAWLVDRVRAVTPRELHDAVSTGRLPDGSAFDPARMALVEDALAPGPYPPLAATARVDWTQRGDTHLSLTVESPTPALLVLSEVHYPGWHATVAGRPAEDIRVNGLLRGLPVPGGPATEVVLRFEPAQAGRARTLATAGWALAGLLLVLRWAPIRLPRPARASPKSA